MYFKTTMGKKAVKLMLRETLRKLGYMGTMVDVVDDKRLEVNE